MRSGRPPLVEFWLRNSPTEMVPAGDSDRVSATNPPMTVSGMSYIVLDPEGRLLELHVVPPEQRIPGTRPAPVDWKPLFEAADLDIAAFTSVEPEWTPVDYTDTRAAWTGPLRGSPELECPRGGRRLSRQGDVQVQIPRTMVARDTHAGRDCRAGARVAAISAGHARGLPDVRRLRFRRAPQPEKRTRAISRVPPAWPASF